MATPVRQQYLDLKARYPDAILLFRLGDFYETFDEDAKLVAEELDIALTSKPMGGGLRSPLAGVPVRSVEQHLAKLVGRGHRVAICEQLEPARAARGLVKRGVVRVVSPGTALEPSLLEAGQASACAALLVRRERRRLRLGVAAADITTGACHVAELETDAEDAAAFWSAAADLLERLGARELLVPDGDDARSGAQSRSEIEVMPQALARQRRPQADFSAASAERALEAQYGAPPAAFGLERERPALGALGALLIYLHGALPAPGRVGGGGDGPAEAEDGPEGGLGDETGHRSGLPHLSAPRWVEAADQLRWDQATERALAVAEPGPEGAGGSGPRSLLEVVDRCGSAPGRRWLRTALRAPLLDLARIEERLARVEGLVQRPALRRALAARLRGSSDLERLFGRTASALAQPAELVALSGGLVAAAECSAMLRDGSVAAEDGALLALAERLGPAPESARRLQEALEPRPAAEFGGGVVRAGVDAGIDRQRSATEAARERLAGLERILREESGIESLRIGFHRTFGYQIELTRAQASRAPAGWERRQSLRDRERFTEPRLREVERELEAAEQRLAEAEREYVERLRITLVADAEAVRAIAGALSRLDAATALASVAAERAWTRPQLEHSGELEIAGGRHPMVEAAAAQGAFVPNDLRLADDGCRAAQLLLVTGPNMAGKSTYLRQTALIVILAQAGSFVPAARARVGLVDRIFARVGAHDELARGRSTFMVEMLETARLLHGAGDRSLVLLDEIGRGTSTWDGLAIAQAVAESLAGGGAADSARRARGPRTLFATHFHELTALAGELPRVANAAVQVEETAEGGIEFLYRIAPGAADRSYGVQVAAQAGLPEEVVERARRLLEAFEQREPAAGPGRPARIEERSPQLMLMPPPGHPILHDLADLDIDGITPLEAISALYALQDQARTELRGRYPDGPAQAAEAGS
jgi:DNA mismatch repair protein MutS